jgi:hypothetical protein
MLSAVFPFSGNKESNAEKGNDMEFLLRQRFQDPPNQLPVIDDLKDEHLFKT